MSTHSRFASYADWSVTHTLETAMGSETCEPQPVSSFLMNSAPAADFVFEFRMQKLLQNNVIDPMGTNNYCICLMYAVETAVRPLHQLLTPI